MISFPTEIRSDTNFFGWENIEEGGHSSFDSSHYSHKIKRVGVYFEGYDDSDIGLTSTPHVYLIPVGQDVMRTPYRNINEKEQERYWTVLQQVIPPPYDLGENFCPRA